MKQKKTQKPTKQQREDFIFSWLINNFGANAVNQAFHEAYHAKFPFYRRKETYFGAQMVAQAQRDLAAMAKSGRLEVSRIGIGGQQWQPGYPKHVLTYDIPDFLKSSLKSAPLTPNPPADNTKT